MNDLQNIGWGKLKQEVIIADATAKAMLTLWEGDINMMKKAKSYIPDEQTGGEVISRKATPILSTNWLNNRRYR